MQKVSFLVFNQDYLLLDEIEDENEHSSNEKPINNQFKHNIFLTNSLNNVNIISYAFLIFKIF